ncbi:MAG: MBL fold metallo-hydrolase [Betaproteobacteria bacterium]
MSIELYNRNGHACVLFTDLVGDENGEAVQANQCLIVDHQQGMLLDPGGVMTYNELFVTMSRFFPPKQLKYVFASHADPDVIASLQRWLSASTTQLLISRIWARFVPHFSTASTAGRIIAVPDEGGTVQIGQADLVLLPAHFLHSEGNFQVYDPVSKILFSGDLGVSLMPGGKAGTPVRDLAALLPLMQGFHRRYIVSNRVCRFWASMARTLDIEMIVPQHGAPIAGQPAVAAFIDWIEQLDCGIDLMTQDNYRVPVQRLALA